MADSKRLAAIMIKFIAKMMAKMDAWLEGMRAC
jgi:hypothetical protein